MVGAVVAGGVVGAGVVGDGGVGRCRTAGVVVVVDTLRRSGTALPGPVADKVEPVTVVTVVVGVGWVTVVVTVVVGVGWVTVVRGGPAAVSWPPSDDETGEAAPWWCGVSASCGGTGLEDALESAVGANVGVPGGCPPRTRRAVRTAPTSPSDAAEASRRRRVEDARACLGDLLAACLGVRSARCIREAGFFPRQRSEFVLSKLISSF